MLSQKKGIIFSLNTFVVGSCFSCKKYYSHYKHFDRKRFSEVNFDIINNRIKDSEKVV